MESTCIFVVKIAKNTSMISFKRFWMIFFQPARLPSLVSAHPCLIQSFFFFYSFKEKGKASFKLECLAFVTNFPHYFHHLKAWFSPLSFTYRLQQIIHTIREPLDILGKCFMHLWGIFTSLVRLILYWFKWNIYAFKYLEYIHGWTTYYYIIISVLK